MFHDCFCIYSKTLYNENTFIWKQVYFCWNTFMVKELSAALAPCFVIEQLDHVEIGRLADGSQISGAFC